MIGSPAETRVEQIARSARARRRRRAAARSQRAHDERAHREREAEARRTSSVSSAGSIAPSACARSTSSTSTRLARVEPVAQQRRRARGRGARPRSRRSAAARCSRGAHEAVAEHLEQRRAISRPARSASSASISAPARAPIASNSSSRLAPEVGVDRPGREAGGPGDVLHPGALVALLDEHLDRGRERAGPGSSVAVGERRPSPSMITVIIRAATTRRRLGEDCSAMDAAGDARRRRGRGRHHRRRGRRARPTSPPRTLSEITGADLWLKFENLQFTGRSRSGAPATSSAHLAGGGPGQRASWPRRPATTPRASPTTRTARDPGDDRHAGRHAVHEGRQHRASTAREVVLARRRLRRRAREPQRDRRPTPAPRSCPRSTTRSSSRARARSASSSSTQVPDLDTIVVPVGGGGLVAGIAVAAKGRRADIDVVGVQVEGYTGMMHALGAGPRRSRRPTIAEGIAVTKRRRADARDRRRARRRLRRRVASSASKQPSRSAARSRRPSSKARARPDSRHCVEFPDGSATATSVVVLSGGNIDARVLSSVLLRALARSGRLVRLRSRCPTGPACSPPSPS